MMNYSFGGDGGMIVIGVRKRSSIRRSLLFSSLSISTSIRRTRCCSQNSSVTRSASAAGKEPRSGIYIIAPCILTEKARRVLIDPTKVGLLVLYLLAIYSPCWCVEIFFTSSLTLWSMSLRQDAISSSNVHPTRCVVLYGWSLRRLLNRKQLWKRKHGENTIYGPRETRVII